MPTIEKEKKKGKTGSGTQCVDRHRMEAENAGIKRRRQWNKENRGMEIREAKMAEIPELSRCYALSWRTAYTGLVPQTYLNHLKLDFWVPSFSRWLRDPEMHTFVIDDAGTIGGVVTFGKARDVSHKGWGEIMSLYLLPEYWNRRLGFQLCVSALKQLQKEGYDQVYLWALDSNERALVFYQKVGFKMTGETWGGQVGGQNVTDIRLTLSMLPLKEKEAEQ
ncbi:MAG: GNAT family N-acetyltransferase [Eubacteriaceae bacterium]|nr:GNAT family N-acetyltransferase [Eubacteriaceae bacterium]